MADKETESWLELMELANQKGFTKEEIKAFIEGRKEDESKSR